MNDYTCVYFADNMGDIHAEGAAIQKNLQNNGIKIKKFTTFNVPQCIKDVYYDILFFDWGGMSMGNSLLESFCRVILKAAEEHPSRYFCMTSVFTKYAMIDACIEYTNIPGNIFLCEQDLIKVLTNEI